MPSTIVTTATGILGREMVHELDQHASQWPIVHELSRSKKEDYPFNVLYNHIDLTLSVDQMTNSLKIVQGEYIFFAAHLDTEKKNYDVNRQILSNFLEALIKTGAVTEVKHIILVIRAKQHGVHLGASKDPMIELDLWLNSLDRPLNF
ncbi:hypothetical protein CC78DRAFT_544919 [Lojkania enalia]|uniref:NAD-dependent epimerase/dehydratase domain-containing protein n=1 Tax=Lojkania enalia TaxID=147567 RepID=A0A9P4N3F9_9PLEO|nr:hypothetical protein CC78DRAFT_544919 [Didymosphaeria enalia]